MLVEQLLIVFYTMQTAFAVRTHTDVLLFRSPYLAPTSELL